MPQLIQGMRGLGDNIYQRAFVKALEGEVWLETPWPEIYKDLPNVRFVKPIKELRTQTKNVNRNSNWSERPAKSLTSIKYGANGIVPGMTETFGIKNKGFDLPYFGPSIVEGKYIVVRPVTVRAEWINESRNPMPAYVAAAAQAAKDKGYLLISVADLEYSKEWALDPLPIADQTYHKGELDVSTLLALVSGASAVISGIGWILPAAIAANVPALIICGGQGGYNAPELITDPSMNLDNIEFLVPDRFCRCTKKDHSCDKRIENYNEKLANWIDRLPPVV